VQFDSLAFLAFFLIIAALYWWVPAWHQRKNVLLAASYLFYAGWNPYFLPLLVITSLIDWRLALHTHRFSTTPQKMVNRAMEGPLRLQIVAGNAGDEFASVGCARQIEKVGVKVKVTTVTTPRTGEYLAI
jgi:hypothetical protein